jgi:hypothetical protein
VLRRLQRLRPEAILDLHNNTGHNPAYGVATSTHPAVLALTRLFAERLVHSDLDMGTLVEATADLAPSVVIECGRAGDAAADETAWIGLERFLTAADLGLDGAPSSPGASLQVLHSPVRVTARPGISLAFDRVPHPGAELTVDLRLEASNFHLIPTGSVIGWASDGALPIQAHGSGPLDISGELFENRSGSIVTRQPIVPVMMTVDAVIALSDCLFYATRRRDVDG